MNQRTADMMKIIKVIKSCETVEHIHTTKKLIKNFYNWYKRPCGDVVNFDVYEVYRELYKEANLQYDKIRNNH